MLRFPFCGYCAFRKPSRYAFLSGSTISRYKHSGSTRSIRYTTRKVHTTVAAQSYWFPVKDVLYNKDFVSRTQEIGTLSDDFGILFLDEWSNSTSKNGESNLLEQLLRFERTSTASDCSAVFVPTTIDQSEIGGMVENGGLEQSLEGLLGDGYDVPAMLTDFQDSVAEREQGVAAVPCGSSSLHMNSIVSQMCTFSGFNVRLPRTRQFITDQMRKDSRNHGHCSISSVVPAAAMASVDTNIKENVSAFLLLTEPEPSTSGREPPHEVNTTRSRFEPELGRTERATLEEMNEVIQSKDVANLRALLQTKGWPLNYGEQAENALMLAVEQSEDCEEASMFFRDFATSSPRAWVRDWVTVSLVTRAAREHSAEEAKRLLESHRHIFMARAPAEHHRDNRLSNAFKELFEVIARNENFKECEMIFNCARKFGYSVNESTFVDQITNIFRNQKFPFCDFLCIWKDLSKRYLTTKGVDILLEMALTDSMDSKVQGKRVEDILAHCTATEHAFSLIAELLCVFVKLNKMEEASALFSKVSISGRHFKGPLRKLQQNSENLVYVERLADLITRCMYGERRRVRTKNSVQTADRQASIEKIILSKHLQRVVDKFCGIGVGRKKNTKRPKEGIKKYKINEEELHDLTGNIQRVWINLAERNRDVAAVQRLQLWCATNRVDIPDRILRKINKILKETTNSSVAD